MFPFLIRLVISFFGSDFIWLCFVYEFCSALLWFVLFCFALVLLWHHSIYFFMYVCFVFGFLFSLCFFWLFDLFSFALIWFYLFWDFFCFVYEYLFLYLCVYVLFFVLFLLSLVLACFLHCFYLFYFILLWFGFLLICFDLVCLLCFVFDTVFIDVCMYVLSFG